MKADTAKTMKNQITCRTTFSNWIEEVDLPHVVLHFFGVAGDEIYLYMRRPIPREEEIDFGRHYRSFRNNILVQLLSGLMFPLTTLFYALTEKEHMHMSPEKKTKLIAFVICAYMVNILMLEFLGFPTAFSLEIQRQIRRSRRLYETVMITIICGILLKRVVTGSF
ncbi:uncharacterized protein LOC126654900 isoform X2 [Mercurialis annua]|uniref:uncharacterized protein LOC126654900 isoform X2 n=1 Tax=Mercurialis annua TaxID=3986 RepID=UPI00215DDF5C|nr:uncharacterized protein LOC126654900 isoform X2 [Mercurialis annua]